MHSPEARPVEGGGKHRRVASRELVADVTAEASLSWCSDGTGRHRRSQSRGLIVDILPEDNSDHEAAASRSTSHKKDDAGGLSGGVKGLDWMKQHLGARSANYDHCSPNPRGLFLIFFAAFLILCALGTVSYLIDTYLLPGFRIIPVGLFLYYFVYSGIRLFIMVEWIIFRTTQRGLQFQPRVGTRVTRAAEVSKLRERLNRSIAQKPPGESTKRPKIMTVTGFGGGGHEATLKGILDVMKEVGFQPEIVELPVTFLVETDHNNPVWQLTGCTGEQLYNWGLKQNSVVSFFMSCFLQIAQACALTIDKYFGAIGQMVGADYGDEAAKVCERSWREHKPDMVINFTTGSIDFMMRGLDRANLSHLPFLVIVSDFEGRGAHSWIEDKRQYTVCGTSICRQQAVDFGLPANQVFQTSGMILRPAFYETDEDDDLPLAERLRKIGLDPQKRTCLIFWGGVASKKVRDIGLALTRAKETLNLIFLCGRNLKLMEELKAIEWPCCVCIEGFTQRIKFYMQVSDMMVCKPGPGVCSEAALLGLPIIVEWSCFTLPQEVAVCKWILNRGLGLGFTRQSQLVAQVNRMCDMLNADRSVLARADDSSASKFVQQRPLPCAEKGLTGFDLSPGDNLAVFEVPGIIQDILDNHSAVPGSRRSPNTSSPKP